MSWRPSFDRVMTGVAVGFAGRSTCKRLHVGCVIASEDSRHIYGVGYNGNASGLGNLCDRLDIGACGCCHAEMNAIANLRASRGEPKHVFLTHSPCAMCAKLLVNIGGVLRVVYMNDYRTRDGLDVLVKCNVIVEQFSHE